MHILCSQVLIYGCIYVFLCIFHNIDDHAKRLFLTPTIKSSLTFSSAVTFLSLCSSWPLVSFKREISLSNYKIQGKTLKWFFIQSGFIVNEGITPKILSVTQSRSLLWSKETWFAIYVSFRSHLYQKRIHYYHLPWSNYWLLLTITAQYRVRQTKNSHIHILGITADVKRRKLQIPLTSIICWDSFPTVAWAAKLVSSFLFKSL